MKSRKGVGYEYVASCSDRVFAEKVQRAGGASLCLSVGILSGRL